MIIDTLIEILTPWQQIEQQGADGAIAQRERLMQIADMLCQEQSGALVEIGCLNGSTTALLAQVAQKYNRKVIAIDPWEIGTQNCDGGEYENFIQSIAPYCDTVEIIRARSDSQKAHSALATRALAFVFVDGLHTYETCLADIRMVQHAGLIAVDDLFWSVEVRRAFAQAVTELNKQQVYFSEFREGYLL